MDDFDKARALLREFKGDAYLFGTGVLSELGKRIAHVGIVNGYCNLMLISDKEGRK